MSLQKSRPIQTPNSMKFWCNAKIATLLIFQKDLFHRLLYFYWDMTKAHCILEASFAPIYSKYRFALPYWSPSGLESYVLCTLFLEISKLRFSCSHQNSFERPFTEKCFEQSFSGFWFGLRFVYNRAPEKWTLFGSSGVHWFMSYYLMGHDISCIGRTAWYRLSWGMWPVKFGDFPKS